MQIQPDSKSIIKLDQLHLVKLSLEVLRTGEVVEVMRPARIHDAEMECHVRGAWREILEPPSRIHYHLLLQPQLSPSRTQPHVSPRLEVTVEVIDISSALLLWTKQVLKAHCALVEEAVEGLAQLIATIWSRSEVLKDAAVIGEVYSVARRYSLLDVFRTGRREIVQHRRELARQGVPQRVEVEARVELVACRYGGAGGDLGEHVARATHRPDRQCRPVILACAAKCWKREDVFLVLFESLQQ